MSSPSASPLMAAVAAYKQQALAELAPEQVQEGVRLLKEINRRLPGHNLLEADKAALQAAGRAVLAEEAPAAKRFLGRELMRFFNAAFAAGLVARHPLTEAAQLPTREDAEAESRAAAAATEIVSGLIEEGIAAGMMLSPMAVPASELGRGHSALGELVEGLDGRWGALAQRAAGLLDVLRVALPVVSIVIALTAVIGGDDPLGARANAAFATGNAMQQIKIMVTLLDSMEGGDGRMDSLGELGRRVGVPTADAEAVFELRRVRLRPTTLFLRHRDSGALVMVGPETRATLADGRLRRRR